MSSMKKSQSHLLSLAAKFKKYANVNAEDMRSDIEAGIWINLRNAAGQRQYGIIPFVQMSTDDGINLSFDISRDDRTITVSNLEIQPVDKANLLSKYQPLVTQIKAFLEKNYEVYPTKKNGQDIDYNHFTIHLNYPVMNSSQVAQK